MSRASVSLDTVPSQFMAALSPNQNWTPGGSNPLPIVVLASGNGSNLQAILERFRESRQVKVVGVASNNPSAYALTRAKKGDVPYGLFPKSQYSDRRIRDDRMADWIEEQGAHLIVLAGYLEILSPAFVDRFRSRIINIHPSLLPDFPGLHSIERAYEARIMKSGITIHVVDEGVDTGPILKQRRIWKRPGESLEGFEHRVHAKEHKLLPEVIQCIAVGKIKLDAPSSLRERRRSKRKIKRRERDSSGDLSLASPAFKRFR